MCACAHVHVHTCVCSFQEEAKPLHGKKKGLGDGEAKLEGCSQDPELMRPNLVKLAWRICDPVLIHMVKCN